MLRDDTICAPATPPGEGGIAVIRVSGPDAVASVRAIFSGRLRDRRIGLGAVTDPRTGDVLDEAMALVMRAPRSFTREDVVELHLHGSPLIVRRVMDALLALGVRAAEPGEFTLRAFLNGRIELSQAESALDLIQARTEAAGRVALGGLQGRIGAGVRAVREALLPTLAYLVARLDFPDEDVPPEEIGPPMAHAEAQIQALLAGARAGRLYREGAQVALIGPPNAGKSSLLNRLLREERAIVTPVAGTTRDTLTETAAIHGIPVTLTDTAGFADAPDPIEALGIERAQQAARQADALLLVLDRAAPAPPGLAALARLAADRPALLVLNKSDLPPALPTADLPSLPTVTVSAACGDGIDALEAALAALLLGAPVAAGEALVSNARHIDALTRARDLVQSAQHGAASGVPEDFIAIDVRAALDTLGEITGETASEDLLDTIFRRFCIGK